MKIDIHEQGSVGWYRARLGVPSASMFHKIITPKTGELSKQCMGYMYKLIAERLLKQSMDDELGHVRWVQRGKDEQPNAERQFQIERDQRLKTVGFITDDHGRYGCSPDALLTDRPEAVEIKCPSPPTQLEYLLAGLGDDYRPQVQGQLLIGEFDQVHFYSYHPAMPSFYLATRVDREFQRKLKDVLNRFCDLLDENTERARTLGLYAPAEWATRPLEQAYPELLEPEVYTSILAAG